MIQEILQRFGIQFKEQSGQIIICCPYCEDSKYHLYIDPAKNVYYCHKCNSKGNWYRLLKQLNPSSAIVPFHTQQKVFRHPTADYIQACHKKLMGQAGVKAIDYLYSRCFSLQAIQDLQLGLESKDGKDWLVIPYLMDGKTANVKYRTIPPAGKEFRRWKEGESILFNQDCLEEKFNEIFMVEGELDAIALFSQGYRNVVATTIGAGGFKPEWVDMLADIPRINIIYDSDEAGQRGAKEIARRLGLDRCFNVLLPVKDVNDFFMSGGDKVEFETLISKAEPFEVDNIINFHRAVTNLKIQHSKVDNPDALKPHWPSVAKLTGAFEPGDLVTLSAIPKTGKSTFALNIVHRFIQKDIPCLFYCLEMRPERLAKKIIQMEMFCSESELTPQKIDAAYLRLSDKPLYFGYNYKKCTLDIVTDTIRQGIKRYGFKFIVFDNLHYLSRSITNQVQEVSLISKTFKLLAEEMQVPIMLIAQPRKVAENQIIGIMDLKDSSAIGADSDQVIILYRKKMKTNDGTAEAAYEPLTLVRVDASRYHPGGETLLYFRGDKSTFKEPSKEELHDKRNFHGNNN
ncbi:MAG: toprim domain-containing protein [Nitrospiraceae bacterium]|nr:toprim domain-containing protein [Nitrospiraceae bacterium]